MTGCLLFYGSFGLKKKCFLNSMLCVIMYKISIAVRNKDNKEDQNEENTSYGNDNVNDFSDVFMRRRRQS